MDHSGAKRLVVRLIQITDTHFSADPAGDLDGVNTRSSFAKVTRHIKRHESSVHGVLATGDLSHDGSAESYAALRKQFETLRIPVYCIPGNHDSPAAMNEALIASNVHIVDSTNLGAWHLVFLNTHVQDWEAGLLGEDRLRRLDNLMSSQPDVPTLVVLHHPPVPIGSPWMDAMGLKDAAEFMAIIDKHPQVRAVIWGHIHQEFSLRRNGVYFWGTPSTCLQFKPGATHYEGDTLAPGYRRLDLLPDGKIVSEVVRVRGSVR